MLCPGHALRGVSVARTGPLRLLTALRGLARRFGCPFLFGLAVLALRSELSCILHLARPVTALGRSHSMIRKGVLQDLHFMKASGLLACGPACLRCWESAW